MIEKIDDDLEMFRVEADLTGRLLQEVFLEGVWMLWRVLLDYRRESLGYMPGILRCDDVWQLSEPDVVRHVAQYIGETIIACANACWMRSGNGRIVLGLQLGSGMHQEVDLLDLVKRARRDLRSGQSLRDDQFCCFFDELMALGVERRCAPVPSAGLKAARSEEL